MKFVGDGRLKLALELEGDLNDDDYINIAVEHGLISSSDVKKAMTEEMCENLLDKLDELYYSDFLRDDYQSVVYADNVIEIPDISIL